MQSSKESRKQRTLRRNPHSSSHVPVPRHANGPAENWSQAPLASDEQLRRGSLHRGELGTPDPPLFWGAPSLSLLVRKYGGFLNSRELVRRGRAKLVERKGRSHAKTSVWRASHVDPGNHADAMRTPQPCIRRRRSVCAVIGGRYPRLLLDALGHRLGMSNVVSLALKQPRRIV
jgi:hypothetical protein